MTNAQARILAEIAALPLDERQELIAQAHETGLLGDSFYARMSAEQRAELEASVAEADRGEGMSAEVVFDSFARKFGLSRPT